MHGILKGLPLLALLLAATIGVAQTTRTSRATLFVNEMPVLTFRTAHAGFTPSERADLLARNLDGVGQADVRVLSVGQIHQISVNGTPLVTVTAAEAKKNGSSTKDLAALWARRLRDALNMPPLQLAESQVALPVGSVKRIRLSGSQIASAVASTDRTDVASVRVLPGAVEVRAMGPGEATITVSSGDVLQTLNLTVRPYAVVLPQSLSAAVAGTPALTSTVQASVAYALRHELKTVPNAKASYQVPTVEQLAPGSSKTLTVPITVTAPGAYPRTGKVNVVVRNLGVSSTSDAELWYDNFPESVKFPQPLFAARLQRTRPARMLYHHVNDSSQPMFIRVQVVNESDQPAKVLIIPGDSTPDRNPVLAGIQAADQYVRLWMYGSGEVISIPPKSTIPLSLRRVGPGETMSGLASLRLIDGPSDLLVRTDAFPPFPVEGKWADALRTSTPWRETGANPLNDYDTASVDISPHVYPDPQKAEAIWNYRVGDRHQFVRIGEHAIARQDNTGVLDGNFGVFYRLKLNLSNPKDQPAVVDVQFIPSAGYSGGIFILDGVYMRSPLLQPQSPWRITRLKLEPGETRTLRLMTIPLSGSSYPATLQIGATGSISASQLER